MKNSLENIPILKLKKEARVFEHHPTEHLLDEHFIAEAIWECLKNNDPEGVLEIIETHLKIVNKVNRLVEKEKG